VYWKLPDGQVGYLVRSTRLHPLMIDPHLPDAAMYWTPDTDYIQAACADINKVYVVTDSDDILVASLMPDAERRFCPAAPRPAVEAIARWCHYAMDSFHMSFFKERIFIHGEDRNESLEDLVGASDKIVEDIITLAESLPSKVREIMERASTRSIAIFGAGGAGQELARALIMKGARLSCFFDSDPDKWGRMIGPLIVARPSQIGFCTSFIAACATDPTGMAEEMLRFGLEPERDFTVIVPEQLRRA
jgi:hypothetical protein